MAPPKNAVNPELEEISNRQENLRCADCFAKAPKWASVNLGALVCIDCSGAHRSLGTHISVVKSATLDKWQQKWVVTVSKLGNTVVNSFFEKNLPDGMRPQAGDREGMARFIRAKYEKREWAPKGQMSPNELLAQGRKPDVYGGEQTPTAVPAIGEVHTRTTATAPAPAEEPRANAKPSAHASRAAPPVAPTSTVDLLDMDIEQPPSPERPLAQLPAQQASAFSFVQTGLQPQQPPPTDMAPLQHVSSLTQQLECFDSGPAHSSGGFPDLFSSMNAHALPPASTIAQPVQAAAPVVDQTLSSFQDGLAALYQQPVEQQQQQQHQQQQQQQQQQNRFAALATPTTYAGAAVGGSCAFGSYGGMSAYGVMGTANQTMAGSCFSQPGMQASGLYQSVQTSPSGGPWHSTSGSCPMVSQMHVPSRPTETAASDAFSFLGSMTANGSSTSIGVQPQATSYATASRSSPPPASRATPGDSFGAIDAFSAFSEPKPSGAPQTSGGSQQQMTGMQQMAGMQQMPGLQQMAGIAF